MKSDLVDIEVTRHHETAKAILVSTNGENHNAVWVPKSLCEFEQTSGGGVGTLTLSERLAIEKGLV